MLSGSGNSICKGLKCLHRARRGLETREDDRAGRAAVRDLIGLTGPGEGLSAQ